MIMDGRDGSETIGLGRLTEKRGLCLVFSQCCSVNMGQGDACCVSVCVCLPSGCLLGITTLKRFSPPLLSFVTVFALGAEVAVDHLDYKM